MEHKKLREYLEYMKDDIYYLSKKISQIDSNIKNQTTEQNINLVDIEEMRKKQENIHNIVKNIQNRINELESNQEHSSDYIEDLDSRFRTMQRAIINHSKNKERMKNEHTHNKLISKIKELEEHFNSEIRRVYDNVFNEILNLKGDVEHIKKKSLKK